MSCSIAPNVGEPRGALAGSRAGSRQDRRRSRSRPHLHLVLQVVVPYFPHAKRVSVRRYACQAAFRCGCLCHKCFSWALVPTTIHAALHDRGATLKTPDCQLPVFARWDTRREGQGCAIAKSQSKYSQATCSGFEVQRGRVQWMWLCPVQSECSTRVAGLARKWARWKCCSGRGGGLFNFRRGL
jgi:hypothetical protein